MRVKGRPRSTWSDNMMAVVEERNRRKRSQELSSGPKQMAITLFNLDIGKVEEDD